MKRFLILFLMLCSLSAFGAAQLVSSLPQTNIIRPTNYVMVVLQSGKSNVTYLVPWSNAATSPPNASFSDLLWTNISGFVVPTTNARVQIGDDEYFQSTATFEVAGPDDNSVNTVLYRRSVSTNSPNYFYTLGVENGVDNGVISRNNPVGIVVVNLNVSPNSGLLDNNRGAIGILAIAGSNSTGDTNAATAGMFSYSGREGLGGAMVAVVDSNVSSKTNFAVSGRIITEGNTGVFTPAYFDIHPDYGTEVTMVPSVILADSFNTGTPLLTLRTNLANGHAPGNLFQFGTDGTLSMGGATNYFNFSATNTPPADTATIVRWITVTADGVIYRMPLYQ